MPASIRRSEHETMLWQYMSPPAVVSPSALPTLRAALEAKLGPLAEYRGGECGVTPAAACSRSIQYFIADPRRA